MEHLQIGRDAMITAMDSAVKVAFDDRAPADERADASARAQQAHMPAALSDLIPRSDIQPIIDHIVADLDDQALQKSLSRQNVIPFPSKAIQGRQPGMQSVWLDDMQISVMGDWYERPGVFGFDSMRAMVEQTPILNAVLMTRQRQVQRFCRVQGADKPGFQIRLKDQDKHPDTEEATSIKLMEGFFMNCGWETNPRRRQRLRRDNFSNFMAKLVRDTLTMDSMPIETEFKRNRKLGLDGMYAVDGATIRLCTEDGYEGEDEIFALQVVQGRVRSVYTYDDLIYVPRNPRTDVLVGGYGLGETELLIRVVTGFLNAFTYNTKYFDSNAIPKGLLHLSGNYAESDVNAFKRYWNAMVKGINNAWTLPVMVSKDQESRAGFENFGVDVSEMMFGKWMTFLASLICAIYGIGPDEINFEAFSTGKSTLSGSDTEEKLADSKDKGLLPLLAYFDNTFTDYIVAEFGDKFEFEWTGFEDDDKKQRFEEVKLCNTVNELRASRGEEKITDAWGDAPLNPSLVGAWQAEQQASQEDYGQPSDDDAPPGTDFGDPDDGTDESDADSDPEGAAQFGKAFEPALDDGSFGLPVLKIEV